jgi:hypothetical protein
LSIDHPWSPAVQRAFQPRYETHIPCARALLGQRLHQVDGFVTKAGGLSAPIKVKQRAFRD